MLQHLKSKSVTRSNFSMYNFKLITASTAARHSISEAQYFSFLASATAVFSNPPCHSVASINYVVILNMSVEVGIEKREVT